jgi:glycosyltransferase involved in cell wall biosynthesis
LYLSRALNNSQKIKLLQIGASWFGYQHSGLERYYADLLIHLPVLGTDVIGLAYELKEAPDVNGLTLVSFGTQDKSVLRKFFDQRRIIGKYLDNDLDLVVSHCTPSLFPSLADLRDKPLICHFHGPRYLERTLEGANAVSVQLSKFVEHKVYRRADHVITLSSYMKRVIVETYGVPEERVSIVPGGVNLHDFKQFLSRADARERLELSPERPIVVAVRRLQHRMGLHNLIEAMREVVRAYPDVLLLIVGKGALRNELAQHIESSSLALNVRLAGAVSDPMLRLLYRAANFSIVPTTAYEGFGLILVESLACGTPVLGTPQGAIPEVLGPLSESLILESAAPQHLGEGMLEALRGKRVLPSSEQCETYAARNYAWPVIASKVCQVYREVLSARGSSGAQIARTSAMPGRQNASESLRPPASGTGVRPGFLGTQYEISYGQASGRR